MPFDLPPQLILPDHYVAKRPAIVRAHRGDLDGLKQLGHERGFKAMLPGMVPVIAGGRPPVVRNTAVDAHLDNNSTSNGNPFPCGLPTYSVGDMLLIIGSLTGGGGPRTVATPDGWNSLFNIVGPSNLRRFFGFWKIAEGDEGGSVNISASTADYWSANAYAIAEHHGFIEAGTATGTSASPNPPSLAPSNGVAPTLWIAAQGDDNNTQTVRSGPSGFGSFIYKGNDTGSTWWSHTSSAYLRDTSGSMDPGTFGLPSSAPWAACTIAIR